MTKDNAVASEDHIVEIVVFSLEYGDEKAVAEYGITYETLARYKRDYKNRLGKELESQVLLKQIQDRYSPKELRALAKGGAIARPFCNIPQIDFNGDRIRLGCITDTHVGSLYFIDDLLYRAYEEFRKEKVDFILNPGDLTDGFNMFPGHVFELEDIGYEAQKKHAIEIYSDCPAPLKVCDGNHDRSFSKTNGAMIVKDICEALPNAEFLGQDVGILWIDKINIMLWHGEDGNSYATSYRLQKIVESLSGGSKPNLLIAGHTHKQAHLFIRNVHVISAGCIQLQTPFMRGRRIEAHTGFWILDIWKKEDSINKLSATWYPFYA